MITVLTAILCLLIVARVLCWGAHTSRKAFASRHARRRFYAIVAALSVIVAGGICVVAHTDTGAPILLAGITLLFFADRRGPFRKLNPGRDRGAH